MPDLQFFSDKVNEFFSGNYLTTQSYVIPEVDQIGLGNEGKEIDAAMLFIDLRESTKIVDGFRRQTAAKMYKSFLWGIAKIARENGGELRSFNGDGVLVAFIGPQKGNQAVSAALQMSFFMREILKPKVDAYLRNNNQTTNIGLDFGIGIDTGKILVIRGGVRGESNNDLVWVGNATNYAVKLSNIKSPGTGHVRIMPSVFRILNDGNKSGNNQFGLTVSIWGTGYFSFNVGTASPSPAWILNPGLNTYYHTSWYKPFS